MNWEEFKIVHVDAEYMKALHNADHEVMYRENAEYVKKPFLGILVTNEEKKYVIPLTSAKEKHRTWADVNQSYYRIYEVIDMRTAVYDSKDIIVDMTNTSTLAENGFRSKNFATIKRGFFQL